MNKKIKRNKQWNAQIWGFLITQQEKETIDDWKFKHIWKIICNVWKEKMKWK